MNKAWICCCVKRTFKKLGQTLDIYCTWTNSGQSLDWVICGPPMANLTDSWQSLHMDKLWTSLEFYNFWPQTSPCPHFDNPWPILNSLKAHSGPIWGPAMAHLWPTHCPVIAHSWLTCGPLKAHLRLTHGPLMTHLWPTQGPPVAQSRPTLRPTQGPAVANPRPSRGQP